MKHRKIPKSLIKWIAKRLKEEGSMDKIDVVAHYDKSLTLSENKQLFEQKYGIYFKPVEPKLTRKQIKQQEIECEFEQRKANLSERFGIELKFV